jgi:hypothetical protein
MIKSSLNMLTIPKGTKYFEKDCFTTAGDLSNFNTISSPKTIDFSRFKYLRSLLVQKIKFQNKKDCFEIQHN